MYVILVLFWRCLDRLLTGLNFVEPKVAGMQNSGCYCLNMSKRRTIAACTAVVLLTATGSGSVSADESLPVPTTSTVVEQFDEETGIIWSQIDDNTIEVSLPD